MSADSINRDLVQLPVWTVHGANWTANVGLEGINAELSPMEQAQEAATIAIAQFKGRDKGIIIQLDEGETVPILGATMIVHLKDTNPLHGFTPFTHEIFANDGFYEDSKKMAALLLKHAKEIAQELTTKEAKDALKATLKTFKKPRKKLKKLRPKKRK